MKKVFRPHIILVTEGRFFLLFVIAMVAFIIYMFGYFAFFQILQTMDLSYCS